MKTMTFLLLATFFWLPLLAEESHSDLADADVRALYAKAQLLFASNDQPSINKAKDIALGLRSGRLLAEGILKGNLKNRLSLLQLASSLPKEEVQKLIIILMSDNAFWFAVGGSEDSVYKGSIDDEFNRLAEGIILRKVTDEDFSRGEPTDVFKKEVKDMRLVWVKPGRREEANPTNK